MVFFLRFGNLRCSCCITEKPISNNTGMIIGIVVGVLVVVILGGSLAVYCHKNKDAASRMGMYRFRKRLQDGPHLCYPLMAVSLA